MGARTMRLDEQAEQALAAVRASTGLSVSDRLARRDDAQVGRAQGDRRPSGPGRAHPPDAPVLITGAGAHRRAHGLPPWVTALPKPRPASLRVACPPSLWTCRCLIGDHCRKAVTSS